MRTSKEGLDLIKRWEGFEPLPYYDAAGLATVGWGHLIKTEEDFDEPLTYEKAEEILKRDLEIAEEAVETYVTVKLGQPQFDALVSFTFNLGARNLYQSTLLKKVNSMDWIDVPNEFIKWRQAGGRALKGLLKRRLEEARMFMEF